MSTFLKSFFSVKRRIFIFCIIGILLCVGFEIAFIKVIMNDFETSKSESTVIIEQELSETIEETPLSVTVNSLPSDELITITDNNDDILTQVLDEELDMESAVTLNGHKVAIDAGHQAKGNFSKEPLGPGSTTMKNKVAGGTWGRTTNVPEYQLTLAVSLLLRDELEARGYEVYMIRETNEVDISNAQRATLANESGSEVFIRIHADGSDNTQAKGMMAICPTKGNPYCSYLYEDSRLLSELVLSNMFASTETNRGRIWETDTMSGINWCQIPVTIIEMGYMTNPEEDILMQTLEYQLKLVDGISNGIDEYFQQKNVSENN